MLHATRERSLGRLGGLIHRMPWVAWCALVGTIAIAGLPPSNGFASEWLLLQAFLFTPGLPQGYLNMLVPVAAAVVALTAALSGYVMVKFYGVVFLGQPREPKLAEAHDAGIWERIGLAWLAIACVLLGLVPATVIGLLDPVTRALTGNGIAGLAQGWLFLAPIEPARASYSPLLVFAVTAILVALAWLLVRLFYHGRSAAHARLGLRLPVPQCAHAGHGRGLRPAGAARVRDVLPHHARTRRRRASSARPTARRTRTGSGTGSTCRWRRA